MLELGKMARDKVTGFKGIITGRASYLTGCDQYSLASKSKGGKSDVVWFDEGRLEVIGKGIDRAKVAGTRPGGPQAHAPAAR